MQHDDYLALRNRNTVFLRHSQQPKGYANYVPINKVTIAKTICEKKLASYSPIN
jgi:hypothetical protein